MQDLFFHAGIGKTGTSFFQHCLFMHAESLKDQGIIFPLSHLNKSIVQRSINGISSGNLVGPSWKQKDYEKSVLIIEKAIRQATDFSSIVFSNEMLFKRINESDSLRSLLIRLNKSHRLCLVFCVRNICDHLVSAYQQSVKRHGQTKTFDEFLKSINYVNPGFAELYKTLVFLSAEGIQFKVSNYSFHQHAIAEHLYSQMGIDPALLPTIQNVPTNRSLTYPENIAILAINRYMSELGQSDFKSGLLTDQIILGMPELKSCKLVLSEPQSENIFSANRLFIDYINQYLPADETISRDPTEINSGNTFPNTMKQDVDSMSILLASFANHMSTFNLIKS